MKIAQNMGDGLSFSEDLFTEQAQITTSEIILG